jgi:hypothetical protein
MTTRGLRVAVRACVVIALTATSLPAQSTARVGSPAGMRLGDLITDFLVDEGVRTRGLPCTTGSRLAVEWESDGPVANPDAYAQRQGRTLARSGSFTGVLSDSVALTMTVELAGNDASLRRVTIHLPSMLFTRPDGSGFFVPNEMVLRSLTDQGLTLAPLKCDREAEGASYGNLVEAVRAPGKTASGLWWFWQSPQQEPTLTLTVLYRRADMDAVECSGG